MDLSPAIQARTLVGEIVRTRPAAVRVLDRYGVDWCCGARRSLADACALAHADLDVVLDAIACTSGRADDGAAQLEALERSRLAEVIAHVRGKHHAFSREEGPRLVALAAKVAGRHGREHPELVRVRELVVALFADLESHMMREERVLFPFIEALERARESGGLDPSSPFGPVHHPIHAMMREHEDAGRMLEELARLTRGFEPPPEACGSWRALYDGLRAHDADLRRHVWIENEILFPAAMRLEQNAAT